jgi:hypothetical protein
MGIALMPPPPVPLPPGSGGRTRSGNRPGQRRLWLLIGSFLGTQTRVQHFDTECEL